MNSCSRLTLGCTSDWLGDSMEEVYKIRLVEYARVTQKLLYTIVSADDPLSEEHQTKLEAALLLSSYALNEQREKADKTIVILLVQTNEILGSLFSLYEETLISANAEENAKQTNTILALLKELILIYEAILSHSQ